MQLYFLTWGIKDQVDKLVNDLQAQFYTFKQENTTTKATNIGMVQGALRPIQLWGYAFPEEHLDVVSKTLNLPNDEKTFYPSFTGRAAWLRRLMKAKEIPKPDPKVLPRVVRNKHVSIMGIGIKEDGEGVIPGQPSKQELL